MSFQNNANDTSSRQANVSQSVGNQQNRKLTEMTEQYMALLREAKNVGESTPKGRELLMNATKLRTYCENYSRQLQQAGQAYNQNRSNAGVGNSSTISKPAAVNPNSAGSTGSQQSRTSGSQLANFIRQVLTPEQNQQHDALSQSFQTKFKNIRDKAAYLQQHIERLSQEINKQTDVSAREQLEEKKAELTNSLKMLRMEYTVQHAEFQNRKKRFYVECARNNPALHQLLQRTTQQQRLAQQQQQAQAQAQKQAPMQPQTQQQLQQPQVQQPQVQQPQVQQPQVQQPQVQQPQVSAVNTTSNLNSEKGLVSTPKVANSPAVPKTQQETLRNVTMQKLPQQNRKQSTSGNPVSKSQSQVTSVNAAASMAANNGSIKPTIFKQSDPVVPISETVTSRTPAPVTYKTNRPSLTGGTAMNAAALNTPAMTKLPPYEVDTERVMSKRKLRELVKSVGIDEGDGETVIDGDVEELLLDLADDFVTNVTGFACRLAKHRKSDNLETRDIQLHLERNWNIRIPGYSGDEIRTTRKWNPLQSYNQKLQTINSEKAASAKNSNSVSSMSSGKPPS